MFYHQLAAWSPIAGARLPRAGTQALGAGADPRTALSAMLQQRYRKNACALYGSGTHALQAALELALQSKEGIVLLPAYTCYEVATAAVAARARVVLYDVDAETLEPDWKSLSTAGGQPVAALVVTPLYGLPLDWQKARMMATQFNTLLVADVAQGFGTLSDGAPAGADADLTVVSFGRGKGWTGAGGGALLSSVTPESTAPCGERRASNEIKTFAKAVSQWLFGRPVLYGMPAAVPFLRLGETVYHHPVPKTGMTRTSAYLLLAGEREAATEVLHRRRNAQEYTRMLKNTAGDVTSMIGARLGESSGALRYPLRVRGGGKGLSKSAIRRGAAAGYPTTLSALPALQPLLSRQEGTPPQAELLARELITLPTHSRVTAAEREALVALICGSNTTTACRNVAQARHPEVGANA